MIHTHCCIHAWHCAGGKLMLQPCSQAIEVLLYKGREEVEVSSSAYDHMGAAGPVRQR